MRKFIARLFLMAACVVCLAPSRKLIFSGNPFRNDWAQRVVNNGGPLPSESTILCMEQLRLNMISLGTNDIYTLAVFVPDSVIAASTPLFIHKGSDPWTNFNFAATNLTVDGLKGDGLTKALDTGLQAANNHAYSNNVLVGISIIVSESNSNRTEVDIGAVSASGTAGQLALAPSNNGRTEWFSGDLGSGLTFLLTNDFVRVGWVSANTVTNAGVTNQNIYIASALEPHRLYASEPFGPPSSVGGNPTLSVFARKQDGTNNQHSAQRLSAALVHFPFTETKSSNVWWALKTCRECLGGGVGDPVKDWSRRLVELGGPTISTTSSNALRTFYSGLANDNLIKNMVVANCFLPDNLFAARTPFIWQNGNQVWTNVAFAESNLTVNGLQGNATSKYLGTGITPTIIVPPFTSISAGSSVLTFAVPSASVHDLSGTGTAANSIFATPVNNSGTLNFFCFKFVTVNTEFLAIAAPSPGATWAGYLSGNRTAANAIRLDWVTNGVHNIATNGTGTQTGSTATITNMYAFANHPAGGTPGNFSGHTISYLSVHSGLTQTQSSNQSWHVLNLRTNLGGGVP